MFPDHIFVKIYATEIDLRLYCSTKPFKSKMGIILKQNYFKIYSLLTHNYLEYCS